MCRGLAIRAFVTLASLFCVQHNVGMSDGWWNWHCKLHEENAVVVAGIDTPLSHQKLALVLADIDFCQQGRKYCPEK